VRLLYSLPKKAMVPLGSCGTRPHAWPDYATTHVMGCERATPLTERPASLTPMQWIHHPLRRPKTPISDDKDCQPWDVETVDGVLACLVPIFKTGQTCEVIWLPAMLFGPKRDRRPIVHDPAMAYKWAPGGGDVVYGIRAEDWVPQEVTPVVAGTGRLVSCL